MFLTIVQIHLKITKARHFFDPTQENIILNPIHIIAPCHYFDGESQREYVKRLKTAFKKYNLKSTLLTFLDIYKQRCITKEKYEEAYKINKKIEERGDLSLGDDLETFVTNMKHGEMTEEALPFASETFLIRLLNANDRKRLDQKDKGFMETFFHNSFGGADVPKKEWESSESNLKFSQSFCWRWTYCLECSET